MLGTVSENPRVCVGVNPSTGVPGSLDLTVSKVKGFASRNRFDSWVMLNLYPHGSTNPNGMHLQCSTELQADNERHIVELIGGRQLMTLAAWGEPIRTRPYLSQTREGIVSVADNSGCEEVSIGDLLKSGHPGHPSRASYDWPV